MLPGAQYSDVGAALLRRFAEDHCGVYLLIDTTLDTEVSFRRHDTHVQQVLGKALRDQSGVQSRSKISPIVSWACISMYSLSSAGTW